MSSERIMCQPGKHLVSVQSVVVTTCRQGCIFRSVACFEHGGFAYTDKAHNQHMQAVKEHGADQVLEQCVDALRKAHRGIAELIVCGCTSDEDMRPEMMAITDALEAAERRGL